VFLCLACTERRLGRKLVQEDLDICVWNAGWIDAPADFDGHSERAWAAWAYGKQLLPHAAAGEIA
jgi:hypothetical protein